MSSPILEMLKAQGVPRSEWAPASDCPACAWAKTNVETVTLLREICGHVAAIRTVMDTMGAR